MTWLGLATLGLFFGYVVGFALRRITDWSRPANVFSAITSIIFPGALFMFLRAAAEPLGPALYIYPVGLAYGLFCSNLTWLTQKHDANGLVVALFVLGFILATFLVIGVAFHPPLRDYLGA